MDFFFNDTATTEIYTLSLHDALPICENRGRCGRPAPGGRPQVEAEPQSGRPLRREAERSEEHTSELQSRQYLVCRLLLEKNTSPATAHADTGLPPTPTSLTRPPTGSH